jgi:gliding motility-associated-like protein
MCYFCRSIVDIMPFLCRILLFFLISLPILTSGQVADDAVTTDEDVPVIFSVAANDSDPDGINPASVDLDIGTTGRQTSFPSIDEGIYSVDDAGIVTFTPDLNFNGSSTLEYAVENNLGNPAGTAFITVTVDPVNDIPLANDDATSTVENVQVSFSVVSNDSDVDGSINNGTIDLNPGLLGIQNIAVTLQGIYTTDGTGSIIFSPGINFTGVSSIPYTVNDNSGATSNQATFTVTVTNVNAAPVAIDDTGLTNEDVAVNINILSNDSDDDELDETTVDLDPSTLGLDNTITNAFGTFTVNLAGVLNFDPALNFNGSASIDYTVNDNSGATSNTATVTITVSSINDLPVANDDGGSTNENVPINIDVVGNDSDVDGTINPASVDLNTSLGGIQNSVSTASGDYTVDTNGLVTFNPAVGFTGTATRNYTVNDNSGETSNPASISILVSNVNTAPVAGDDTGSTNEDVTVNINVLINDTDDDDIDQSTVDLDPSTAGVQATNSTPEGNFSVNASGVLSYVPAPNFNGTATVDYIVDDNEGLSSNTATVTITVNSVNDLPVANDDATTTNEEIPVTINVVGNDTDVDGTINTATVDLNTSASGIQNSRNTSDGTYSVNASGIVTFTPALNFSGTALLTYAVDDNSGGTSNNATITIVVSNVNQNPVAADDAATTVEDNPVSVNVLSNDTDDGSLAPATTDLDPSVAGRQTTHVATEGTFSINNTGVLTFTPAADFNGTANVQYTIEDDEGATSNSATVTITVTAENDLPIAVADAGNTNEDNAVTLNVLTNDSDPDGTLDATTVDLDISTAGIQNTRTTASGTYSVDGSGNVAYTPTANFNGVATVQYTVRDNAGGTSNAATLTITVNPVNDLPVAANDAASTDEGDPVAFNVVSNDTDDGSINATTVDLNTSAGGIQSTITVPGGVFTVNSSGVVTYSPTANFNGVVTINYTVNDNSGATSNQASITVTVNSVNNNPVASNDAASASEDFSVTFNVTSNDTDDTGINSASVDLNTTTAGIQNSRTTPQGTFTVDASGNVTFTPVANFAGSASANYTVNDSEGATSNVATINVTVNPVNDEPVAVNDSKTTNEDTPVTINVISNDSDVDGTIVANSVDLNTSLPGIQSSNSTVEGTYTANASGVVTFVPVNNFFGSSSISYTITDDGSLVSNAAIITVTVTAVNDAPIANNDIASTDQGVPVTFNVITNDLDVDGSVNASTVDLNPATGGIQTTRTVGSGTYSVDASGNVTLVPLVNFSGTSTITYTVNDNAGTTSNAGTISVLVNFINQAPVAQDDAVSSNEDASITINVVANDTDDGSINASTVDLNPVTGGIQASLTTTEGSFSVSSTGVVTFVPTLNFNGTATINYTVNDNIGETSNIASIVFTVTPVNDAPVATNDAVSTNEDTQVSINVIANDSDPDGTINAASVDLIPGTDAIDATRTIAQGTFSAGVNGVVVFTPSANIAGSASTTYNVRDNTGTKSNNATITVTIANVNDPPTFNVIDNQRVLKNSAQTTVLITGISPGPSEAEQLLLTATSQNTSLIPHPSNNYPGTGTTASLFFKPQLNQVGTAEIVVKAVDGALNEFSRSFQITVVDVSITSTPVTLAIPGEVYEYNITTTDIPETLSLVAVQKPAWATLSSTGKNTAKLSGTPPANASTSTVTIQLRDGAAVIDEQQFVLEINKRPFSSPFALQSNEDIELLIGTENFVNAYSDPDNHPLSQVQIVTLPRHGTLLLNATPLTLPGQIIPASELNSLTYKPAREYSGLDTVYYKSGDAYTLSLDPSYFHFTIAPVNDAPIITDIESEPLIFDIGRELAQIFTNEFRAFEPDGENITGAVIGFRVPNFDPEHDLLEFANTAEISGTYDEEQGILTLSGIADTAKYRDAIRSITYNFVDLDDIILEPRTIYITLSDGVNTSAPKERIVKLVYDFVELQIPNVFSPDNNQANDLWKISAPTGLQQYNDAQVRIFDKRGRMVFEAIGFDNPWDGTMNGRELPAETYFYTVDLKYGNIKYTGTVTILRDKR